MSKGIIYYTDNKLSDKLNTIVRFGIKEAYLPIVSASLKPIDFGKNIVIDRERGYETYFMQILAALEASESDIIFFCEHDVLYHPSHFDFTPKDKNTFYYNHNWIKIGKDGRAVTWEADQVSGLCAYRDISIEFYKDRLSQVQSGKFDRRYEPMSGHGSKSWRSPFPNIDIRHDKNLTKSKWSLDDFRDKSTSKGFREMKIEDIPGWGLDLKDIYE